MIDKGNDELVKYPSNSESEPKMVIVMRKDLNMRKGKMIAQGSHAVLGAILNLAQDKSIERNTIVIPLCVSDEEISPLQKWLNGKFKKITVGVNSREELLEIYRKAIDKDINVKLILDSGLTEFGGVPTLTCLALGPDWPEVIDPLTQHLFLL